ncbi:PriCT-2 domain-containing protein [Beduini massiliensis]|uniref:PriCT-2 domain-containing protein n=1 Tax=Beduini massiliensis TaxID=1585974 RepID=UPI002950037B|nr:PriCT-2 domain-containing protein [Beduini massiliensis]
MENKIDLLDFLEYIDPSALNYQEWINIGMALKYEGYTAHDWDLWSKRDPQRYHVNECYRKWDTFEGSSNPVTGGTIVQLAKENGWAPNYTYDDIELDWDATIKDKDDFVIVDKNWIEGQEIQYPKHWDPVKDLITYIETLFSSTENVGYVTRTWEKDGKFLP